MLSIAALTCGLYGSPRHIRTSVLGTYRSDARGQRLLSVLQPLPDPLRQGFYDLLFYFWLAAWFMTGFLRPKRPCPCSMDGTNSSAVTFSALGMLVCRSSTCRFRMRPAVPPFLFSGLSLLLSGPAAPGEAHVHGRAPDGLPGRRTGHHPADSPGAAASGGHPRLSNGPGARRPTVQRLGA